MQSNRPSPETRAIRRIPLLEGAFTVFVLLLATGAFLNLGVAKQAGENPEAGSQLMQFVWASSYIVLLFLSVRFWRPFMKAIANQKLLIFLLLLTAASTFWSGFPAVTLRRTIALLFTCLFGVYFAERYTVRQQLILLAWSLGIAACFSVVFQLLGIGKAVDDIPGWFGVYVQRNQLGRAMALSVVVFLFLRLSRRSTWLPVLGATGSILLILLSRSMTAMVGLLILWLLLPISRFIRKHDGHEIRRFLLVSAVALCAMGITISNWELITKLINRDPTMTGRLQIWVFSSILAMQKPWFGYGFSAFWLGAGSPSEVLWKLLKWEVPNAHNGVLQLWLDLGIIGILIFAAHFTIQVRRSIRLVRDTVDSEPLWPLAILVFLAIFNLTESMLLVGNSIFWILYISVSVILARPCWQDERQQFEGPRLNQAGVGAS